MLWTYLERFCIEQDGGATVDWVVLTAALAGFGSLVLFEVASGARAASDILEGHLTTADVPSGSALDRVINETLRAERGGNVAPAE